jgi:hypothetical protein
VGERVPSISVPALYYDQLLDEYLNPPGTDWSTDGKVLAAARRQVIAQKSAEWGQPQETLLRWVSTRLNWRDYQNPTSASRELAASLANDLANTERYPTFVNPDGTPYGQPQDHPAMLEELRFWRARVPNMRHAPPQIQALDRAERLGEVRRVWARYLDTEGPGGTNRYPHWAAWYGVGREASPQAWAAFISGEQPRYRLPNLSAQQQFQMDAFLAAYEAMPDGPEKRSMRVQARQIRRLQTPKWREMLGESARHAALDQLEGLGLASRPGAVSTYTRNLRGDEDDD